jgi:L-fucose isomerase-like protein
MKHQTTLAVILGTRDFFPAEPVRQGRGTILSLLDKLGVDVVTLAEHDTPLGAVETLEQSKKCAELFRAHRDRIDGILVALPVFGPEKAVADAIRPSDLHVPILVQADPDDPARLSVALRRDAFCGKISVCNNLYQYGYPFSLTADHVVEPTSADFERELTKFIGVCRVVKGLKRAHRRHRRAAQHLQHGALQRDDVGGLGHQHPDGGHVRDLQRRGEAGR